MMLPALSFPTDIAAALTLARSHDDPEALYRLLAAWCVWQIQQGNTQEGGDVLAFLLRQPMSAALHEAVSEVWDELASRACPRLLADARDFGSRATLDDVLEYVLA